MLVIFVFRYIKIIKWEAGANSGDEFDFSEEPKKIGRKYIKSICLTKDEKYLLVGSRYLLSVFDTKTREVIKEFKMTNYVKKKGYQVNVYRQNNQFVMGIVQ